jgi:hypothetical protein
MLDFFGRHIAGNAAVSDSQVSKSAALPRYTDVIKTIVGAGGGVWSAF